MSELAPCPACKRHVLVSERACPFCAHALPALRPQRVSLTGRVSRAAVFAALAACSKSDKPKQPPPAAHGSDDLEKMLDDQPRAADHPDALASDAAIAIDAPALADAGVDAALPDAGVRKKKRHVDNTDVREHDVAPPPPPPPPDWHNIPKPYGAPPARRRIV